MLAGCKDNSAAASDPQRSAAPPHLAGVYPEQWRCDSIASLETLGRLLGGTAKQIDSALPVPHGLPHPCSYEILTPEPEYWTFDIDCRDGMKQRADALFAQYRDDSSEAVARYATLDAGVGKPGDAGVARPPEPAVSVAVGAKGLDHHGEGLIFIDDDAPCYVRVAGKDAARRLELARLIAKALTPDNAPMVPRAKP
ncbi:MAG TPA: hypothetical protein VIX73_28090 [Kofleriaceae bacterium]